MKIETNLEFQYRQTIYAILDYEIYKGEIDAYDIYSKKYLVYFETDLGNEWCEENILFATREEAEAKLKEIGEEVC